MKKSLRECHLYGFIDAAYLHGRSPSLVASQLCEGGVDIVQIRAKSWGGDEIVRLAESVKQVVEAAGVPLVINDHPAVARSVGASFVHLGQEDFFGQGHQQASEITGESRTIGLGLSTHAPDQAQMALATKPDYIAIGPVFPTMTKPGRASVTLDYVRWAAGNVTLPWFAIGGITLENIDDVLAAGATRVCVVSAILNAPDVAKACQQFKKRLASAR